MNFAQRLGTTVSIATLVVLSTLPLTAFANEGRDRDARELRSSTQRVEIAITDSGNVLVRGGKVTGINGTSLTISTIAGASTLSWVVSTDGTTAFVTSTGAGSALAQITVGNTVSFAGILTGSGLTVKANAVKNWTLGAQERSLSGTVQSVSSTSTLLTLGNNKTIQFTGSTNIVLNGATTTFASIQVGDKVKASGTMNSDGTILTAISASVIHPAVSLLGREDFRIKVKSWFSNHGFGIFGKDGRGN